MHIAWISLLALAVAAPFAAAQDAPFAFEDPPFDALPAAAAWADLVVGSAEIVDDKTLRTTLQLAFLPEMQPGLAYVFLFAADDGTEHYAGAATAPTLEYLYGRWDGDGPSTMSETSGSMTIGPGGTVVVDYPLLRLGNATMLSNPRGLVLDVKPDALPTGGPMVELDFAESDATLALVQARAPAADEAEAASDAEADEALAPAATASPAAGEKARVPLAPLAAVGALLLAIVLRGGKSA